MLVPYVWVKASPGFQLQPVFHVLFRVSRCIALSLCLSLSLSFSPDNGFIPDSLLEDVMKALDLVSEPE